MFISTANGAEVKRTMSNCVFKNYFYCARWVRYDLTILRHPAEMHIKDGGLERALFSIL